MNHEASHYENEKLMVGSSDERGLPKVAPKPLAVGLPTIIGLFCTDLVSDL